MRIVALLTLTLLLAVSTTIAQPLDGKTRGTYDECANRIYADPAQDSCVRFDVGGAPAQATDTTSDYVYLWLGKTGDDSTSAVTGDGAMLGVLYADSNGAKGLQRTAVPTITHVVDNSLLI